MRLSPLTRLALTLSTTFSTRMCYDCTVIPMANGCKLTEDDVGQ